MVVAGNGDTYTGSWRAGKQHGSGTTHHDDGRVVHQQWDEGRPAPGHIRISFPSSSSSSEDKDDEEEQTKEKKKVLEGEISEAGKITGRGYVDLGSGEWYDGDVVEGIREGQVCTNRS